MPHEPHNFINVSRKNAEANRLTYRLFQLEARVDELELRVEEISSMLNFLMMREVLNESGDDEIGFCPSDENDLPDSY